MKYSRGFTLVETLVAIAILTIAISGPFVAAQRSFIAASIARDQFIATFLAQEALEYIHAIRDDNYLAGRDWLSGLGACEGGSSCTVDPTQEVISACNGICGGLALSDTGLYNQTPVSSTNHATPFTRTVTIEQINPTEVRITVSVSFNSGHASHTVSAKESLFNWL